MGAGIDDAMIMVRTSSAIRTKSYHKAHKTAQQQTKQLGTPKKSFRATTVYGPGKRSIFKCCYFLHEFWIYPTSDYLAVFKSSYPFVVTHPEKTL